jgi:hypothetical protein
VGGARDRAGFDGFGGVNFSPLDFLCWKFDGICKVFLIFNSIFFVNVEG